MRPVGGLEVVRERVRQRVEIRSENFEGNLAVAAQKILNYSDRERPQAGEYRSTLTVATTVSSVYSLFP